MRPAIILFAKAPAPGQVKTRLQSRYSPEQAAGLHDAFVRDLLESLLCSRGAWEVELHTNISTDAWPDAGVPRRLQVPGDLGRRMLHALETALGEGRPQAMILGADVPALPAGHLERLLVSGADVALGPTSDGGYYAIACRRTHARMFDGVAWSTDGALAETAAACERCGLSVELGEPWFDVDHPADVERLAALPDLPVHTRAWLVRHAPELLPG